jgi:arginase
MARRPLAIVDAPSTLGLRSTGVEHLSACLLQNGLAERLSARRAGRVEPLPRRGTRDPVTLTLDADAIASWSPRLADAVGQVLDRGELPIVLGGDCSILLGSALALKRRGRFGLLFVDGHADFYQPEANPNGEAASMELALATGHGPALLANLDGCGPLVRVEDTVVLGFRDAEEQRRYGSQPLPSALLALDLAAVRGVGVDRAMAAALARLSRPEVEGFFIHFDADSLSDHVMPAVDYPLPGGFSLDEMTSILALALASERAVGLEVTIYNPALDPDGSAGSLLTDLLVAAFGIGRN